MNKIKRISLFFRIIFQVLFIAFPIFLIIGWINAPESLNIFANVIKMNVIPPSYTSMGAILHKLSAAEKLLGFLINSVPLLIELFILYSLIKLFRLFERGEIFSINNVRYIRNIGYGLLAGQLLDPIYESIMGLFLTWYNPPGHRLITVTFDQTNFGTLLTALLVILISWIMAEGCKLREEQQLTV